MSARDVARAIDALRRGWPIAIRGAGDPVGLLAIETADAGRMKAFDPEGESPILLSAGRAATLKLANQLEAAIPDSPVLVERTFWIDFDCAVALADPQLDMATPMKGPFRAIHVEDRDVMAAALSLARTAGVLPAFFVGSAPDEVITIADIEAFEDPISLAIAAHAKLPVAGSENSEIVAFRSPDSPGEHVALIIGRVQAVAVDEEVTEAAARGRHGGVERPVVGAVLGGLAAVAAPPRAVGHGVAAALAAHLGPTVVEVEEPPRRRHRHRLVGVEAEEPDTGLAAGGDVGAHVELGEVRQPWQRRIPG